MEFGIASFMHFSDGKKHCFYKSCKHMHRQSRIKQIIWKYEQIFEHVWKLNLKIANCFPLDVCCLVEFANFLSRPSQIMISISKTSHRGLYTWYQFCIVVLTLLTKAGGIGHPLRFTKPDIPLLQFVLVVRQAQVLFLAKTNISLWLSIVNFHFDYRKCKSILCTQVRAVITRDTSTKSPSKLLDGSDCKRLNR